MSSSSMQSQTQTSSELGLDDFSLDVPKVVQEIKTDDIAKKVDQIDPQGNTGFTKLEKHVIANLDAQADAIVNELLAVKSNSEEFRDLTADLSTMGDKEVNTTSNLSNAMLSRRSMRGMKGNEYGAGAEIAKQLQSLRSKVVELDPKRRDQLFNKDTWFGLKLPFSKLRNKVDDYFQEYKSAETQIRDIVNALNSGKDMLIEDNAEIDEEKEQMQELMGRLEQCAYVMKRLDSAIERKLPSIEAEDRIKAEDVKQEILFPIRQKRMDILQHLAVSMQGYMALQVLKRNNQELIRGVDRATKTTVAALRTAVMVSECLGTQKLVLDQVSAVNDITNRMIESTNEQLGKQGTEIQKQATETAVNVAVLEKAFDNIFKAMDSMDTYRLQALPNMQKTIDSLEKTISSAKGRLTVNKEQRIGNFVNETIEEAKSDAAPKGGAIKIR